MNQPEQPHGLLERPVLIAPGVFWVGSGEPQGGLYCNPYLVVDGDEGILIDGGSRPEFSRVMMKIMQAGLAPAAISTLIYQHYDPDLCGSVSLLEEIIGRPDLRIISKHENNLFIRFYGCRNSPECIDRLDRRLTLRSGRVLRFLPTPYAHTPGSFMTYDETTGILFSSDLLGSFSDDGELRLEAQLPEACHGCTRELPAPPARCEQARTACVLYPMVDFHRVEMPTARALRLACATIRGAGAKIVAPQHGGVWTRPQDVLAILARLEALQGVGIDRLEEAPCS